MPKNPGLFPYDIIKIYQKINDSDYNKKNIGNVCKNTNN